MSDEPFITCLWFDTEGEAAAAFYTSIFKNSSMGRVARYTEAMPDRAGSVITVEFELNGQKFLALNGGPEYKFTPAISLMIPCEDQAEVDYYWSRLAEDGQEVACGWVTDRYGVSWQVYPTVMGEMMTDPDPEKVRRVTEAMMKMVKLDIAALEAAYAG
ncbi:MAG TPA: VOC family protein [Streptosporangiaceae bacterium]|nr:VOC family protein [Streptosporangiaceae bacterium]